MLSLMGTISSSIGSGLSIFTSREIGALGPPHWSCFPIIAGSNGTSELGYIGQLA